LGDLRIEEFRNWGIIKVKGESSKLKAQSSKVNEKHWRLEGIA
jgi:hypothetical protein